jgi:hypothetical protein
MNFLNEPIALKHLLIFYFAAGGIKFLFQFILALIAEWCKSPVQRRIEAHFRKNGLL